MADLHQVHDNLEAGVKMEEKEEMKKKKQKQKGGIKTLPFILANEVFEKFAASGSSTNMITYLTKELHMSLVEASNTISNFAGAAALTPIAGALLADSFAGRFWTIAAGSLLYQLGMLTLTLSAAIPALRPPSSSAAAATAGQLSVLYASLLLSAVGIGGIRPCVVAFGADQVAAAGGGGSGKWSFFNLYFFCMGGASLLALTVVVYIQENVSWAWGIGIPTIGMFFSLLFFLIGLPLYVVMKPAGSPLTRLAQVAVAAFHKKNIASSAAELYHDDALDADISTAGKLAHTDHLAFLDRAAIVTSSDIDPVSGRRPWRLSTVHRVEELKCIIRMLPIWSAGILLVVAGSHSHAFAVLQARAMDRRLSTFEIPPASVSVFNVIPMLLALAAFDRAAFSRRGVTYLHRLGAGMVVLVVADAVAAVVEARRKRVSGDAVPMSVFWLVPQFAVHGVADALMSPAHMEFLYDQAPESMRSTAAALFWLAVSVGNYAGTVLVTVVNEVTAGEWLQSDIDRGNLDYYYWLVAGIQVVNLVYFLVCSKFYTFKTLTVAAPVTEQGDGVRSTETRVDCCES